MHGAGAIAGTLSGHWAVHLESRVPRTELYEARIASSKPSLGFFILLISSAVIAIAAAVAGSFSMTRKQLSNSIAGVAIAVALVPPLYVSGIGLTLGSEMVAVFGRGTVAGLTNQIAEGSFLLF